MITLVITAIVLAAVLFQFYLENRAFLKKQKGKAPSKDSKHMPDHPSSSLSNSEGTDGGFYTSPTYDGDAGGRDHEPVKFGGGGFGGGGSSNSWDHGYDSYDSSDSDGGDCGGGSDD